MNLKKMCGWACGIPSNNKHLDLMLLLLRVALGIAFIFHGWPKVSNMEGTMPMFVSMNVPAVLAYIAAYTEFLGGVALLLGIATRLAGGLLVIFMAAAIYLVHLNNGYSMMNQGYEYQLLLAVGALFIAAVGPGKYSLHERFCKGGH